MLIVELSKFLFYLIIIPTQVGTLEQRKTNFKFKNNELNRIFYQLKIENNVVIKGS